MMDLGLDRLVACMGAVVWWGKWYGERWLVMGWVLVWWVGWVD